jgi:hypothetical protein
VHAASGRCGPVRPDAKSFPGRMKSKGNTTVWSHGRPPVVGSARHGCPSRATACGWLTVLDTSSVAGPARCGSCPAGPLGGRRVNGGRSQRLPGLPSSRQSDGTFKSYLSASKLVRDSGRYHARAAITFPRGCPPPVRKGCRVVRSQGCPNAFNGTGPVLCGATAPQVLRRQAG